MAERQTRQLEGLVSQWLVGVQIPLPHQSPAGMPATGLGTGSQDEISTSATRRGSREAVEGRDPVSSRGHRGATLREYDLDRQDGGTATGRIVQHRGHVQEPGNRGVRSHARSGSACRGGAQSERRPSPPEAQRATQGQPAARQDRHLGRWSRQTGGRRQRPIHRAGRSPRTPGGAPSQHRAAGIGDTRCGLGPGSRRRQDAASRRHRLRVARTNGRRRRRPERHRILRAPGHVTQRKLRRGAAACSGCRQRSDLRALERRIARHLLPEGELAEPRLV